MLKTEFSIYFKIINYYIMVSTGLVLKVRFCVLKSCIGSCVPYFPSVSFHIELKAFQGRKLTCVVQMRFLFHFLKFNTLFLFTFWISFGGVASYAGKYPCSFINTVIGSSWVLSLISKKGPLWFGVAVKLGQIVFSLVYCGFHVYERLLILLSTSAPSCVKLCVFQILLLNLKNHSQEMNTYLFFK